MRFFRAGEYQPLPQVKTSVNKKTIELNDTWQRSVKVKSQDTSENLQHHFSPCVPISNKHPTLMNQLVDFFLPANCSHHRDADKPGDTIATNKGPCRNTWRSDESGGLIFLLKFKHGPLRRILQYLHESWEQKHNLTLSCCMLTSQQTYIKIANTPSFTWRTQSQSRIFFWISSYSFFTDKLIHKKQLSHHTNASLDQNQFDLGWNLLFLP